MTTPKAGSSHKSKPQQAARVLAKHLRQAQASSRRLLREHDPEQSVGRVHELRVALRRLSVAAKIFAVFLPPKAADKLSRKACRLRRKAGALRDDDVLRADVMAVAAADPKHARAATVLVNLTADSRSALLKALRRELKHLNKDEFWDWAETKVVRKLRQASDEKQRLRSLAVSTISTQLAALRSSLGAAQGGEDSAVHAARIAGKRVRYSLEVFSACLGNTPGGDMQPLAMEIQNRLGSVHDAQVFAERCRHFAAAPELAAAERQALKRLAAAYERRAKGAMHAFRAFCAEHEAKLAAIEHPAKASE